VCALKGFASRRLASFWAALSPLDRAFRPFFFLFCERKSEGLFLLSAPFACHIRLLCLPLPNPSSTKGRMETDSRTQGERLISSSHARCRDWRLTHLLQIGENLRRSGTTAEKGVLAGESFHYHKSPLLCSPLLASAPRPKIVPPGEGVS